MCEDYNVFGAVKNANKLYGYYCWTDEDITAGDEVVIVNSNCEFEWDTVARKFENNLLYCFICDLQIIDADFSGYDSGRSNNGGGYAFATCKVLKVHDKSY